jgi:hypothetical protein
MWVVVQIEIPVDCQPERISRWRRWRREAGRDTLRLNPFVSSFASLRLQRELFSLFLKLNHCRYVPT